MNVEVTQCSWRRGEVGSGADEWNRLKRAVCSSDVPAQGPRARPAGSARYNSVHLEDSLPNGVSRLA